MTDREALREAVARAIHERRLGSSSDDIADAALSAIGKACADVVLAQVSAILAEADKMVGDDFNQRRMRTIAELIGNIALRIKLLTGDPNA